MAELLGVILIQLVGVLVELAAVLATSPASRR